MHINSVLVRADSAEEAYAAALELGRQQSSRSANLAGEAVVFRFLGLHDLNVIHDPLEHGAELSYRELLNRSAASARALVSKKDELGVFAPREPSSGPDYASGDVMHALMQATGLSYRALRGGSAQRRKRRSRR